MATQRKKAKRIVRRVVETWYEDAGKVQRDLCGIEESSEHDIDDDEDESDED